MYSQNSIVFMKNVVAWVGTRQKMDLMQKWKHMVLINLIDQLIFNKRLILQWFNFSMFAYFSQWSINLTQHMVLY